MSARKAVVETYIDGFRRSDHEQVLSCLTDDVLWEIHGHASIHGKAEFDKEIENDAFVGRPALAVTRMVEEDDVVVAEGAVHVMRRAGGLMHAVLCDVFLMREGRIRRLTSYVVEVK